jgi:hypothetical protein
MDKANLEKLVLHFGMILFIICTSFIKENRVLTGFMCDITIIDPFLTPFMGKNL